ncbi:choice-of-anchor P family protein [Kutzneria viridogrisea]|uniref:Secreted protein n=2 Tax=Kutzneria TaxID=43356 RepID=W5W249_9PSEU|nr:choice-of-anchor P family protein [Kutzneria albida]AHH94611.1 hypothetical protein KALB_1238 [Kutzneria albida DSM 43870]MBA8930279.1 hypothetical protein [Kutzneria viridogrisea]
MRMRMLRRGGLIGLAATAALLAGTAPAWADAGDGTAKGATVDVKLLGADAVKAGPFASAQANSSPKNSFLGVKLNGVLSTGVINASAHRDEDSGEVDAAASIVGAKVDLLKALGAPISADVIEARCTATQQGQHGSAKLAGVNLGALGKVAADPAPNTELALGLAGVNIAKVVFNEQVRGEDGSLTVNAVHIRLLGGVLGSIGSGDVVLASATCGPAGLPIPMASGAGLWIGLGLLGAAAVPAALVVTRRRRLATATA